MTHVNLDLVSCWLYLSIWGKKTAVVQILVVTLYPSAEQTELSLLSKIVQEIQDPCRGFPCFKMNQKRSSVCTFSVGVENSSGLFFFFVSTREIFAYTGPDRNWETRGEADKKGATEAFSSWFGKSTPFTDTK